MKTRSKRRLVLGALATLMMPLGVAVPGCRESTEVTLQPAPPVEATPSQPVPTDPKKGGVPGSSGYAKRNPGASS
jgi:hypothetical protein